MCNIIAVKVVVDFRRRRHRLLLILFLNYPFSMHCRGHY